MKKIIFTLSVCFIFLVSLQASTTDTICIDKDAWIRYTTNPSRDYYQTTNYGSNTALIAQEWTSSGYPYKVKSLIDLNLDELPSNIHVVDAQLYLYGTDHINNNTTGSTSYKSNASYLRRVISPWEENTVTWNTAPSVTTHNQVIIPNSVTTTDDEVIDVTNLVRDMLNYPNNSYGLMMQLVTEQKYTKMQFASSDYTIDTTMRPKLIIEYVRTKNYEIGEGVNVMSASGDWNINPFCTDATDSRKQLLYLASELEAKGMVAGDIYGLAFDADVAGADMSMMYVKVGQTSNSALGSSYLSGLTTVYSGSYVPQDGWNYISFASPFTWDGSSNIVVEVCFGGIYDGSNSQLVYTNTGFNSVRGYAEYYVGGCGMTYGYLSTSRANIRFTATKGDLPYSTPTSLGSYQISPSSQLNYIRKATAQEASGTSATLLNQTQDPYAVNESIEYYDGLGRPIQSIAVCNNPNGKDMVKPVTYDEYGRQVYDFLAYPADHITYNGGYRGENWESPYPGYNDQLDFFQGHFGLGTANPYAYAKTIYESSPLNRVLAQGAPGDSWQPAGSDELSGHTRRFEYAFNAANDIRICKENNGAVALLGYYDDNELYMNVVYGENYDETTSPYSYTIEYKDKEGRVILKEAFTSTERLRTYYVYDDLGMLKYVLSPEFSKLYYSSAPYLTIYPATPSLKQYCYYYEYDDRQRMILKRLPGAESVYMVYDSRDRLVLTQDGERRNDGEWLFTTYDQLNRPAVTGIWDPNSFSWPSGVSTIEDYSNFQVSWDNTNHDYTLSSLLISSGSSEILTKTYYDEYDFKQASYFDSLNIDTIDNVDDYTDNDGTSNGYFDLVKGQVTGTATMLLDGNNNAWICTVNYYDDRYRIIQQQSAFYQESSTPLYPSWSTMSSTCYNFVGNPTQMLEKQTLDSETNSLLYTYSYDHAGRSLETWISVNGNSDILLSQNQYNDLGELKEKNLHCADQSTLLQSVDYEYNIRGWLTAINEPGNLEENDVFAMELYYDQVHGSVSNNSQYNGNISAVVWTSDQSLDRSAYKFDYDPVNRISAADFTAQDAGTWGSSNSYGTDYSYDLNGNITTLQRYDGSASLIDNLTYSYTGNQLQEVQDATNDEDGFSDDGSSGTDYTYDVNGNMTTDLNKQITVSYNHLNLPKKVEAGGASSDEISYIYDAVGTKWFKQISNSSLTDVAYCGSFVYKDAGADGSYGLDYMLNPEGRIDFDTTGDYAFSYLLKDHLGNTRATLDEDGNLLQLADYYPFGMAFDTQEGGKNKYLYNGKELQDDELGGINLDWYDYGARFYDPALARWHTLDPQAERAYQWSPYNYTFDNPIYYTDPDGEFPWGLLVSAARSVAAKVNKDKPKKPVAEVKGSVSLSTGKFGVRVLLGGTYAKGAHQKTLESKYTIYNNGDVDYSLKVITDHNLDEKQINPGGSEKTSKQDEDVLLSTNPEDKDKEGTTYKTEENGQVGVLTIDDEGVEVGGGVGANLGIVGAEINAGVRILKTEEEPKTETDPSGS